MALLILLATTTRARVMPANFRVIISGVLPLYYAKTCTWLFAPLASSLGVFKRGDSPSFLFLPRTIEITSPNHGEGDTGGEVN